MAAASVGGRAGADDVLGVRAELDQPRADEVVARLDDRHLDGEAVREREVVGVHAGHDVVRARGQPGVERGAEADVARQRDDLDRHRARGRQLVDRRGERGGDRTVTHDDDLVGRPGLLLDARRERRGEVVGPVTGPHRQQQRQLFGHRPTPLLAHRQ